MSRRSRRQPPIAVARSPAPAWRRTLPDAAARRAKKPRARRWPRRRAPWPASTGPIEIPGARRRCVVRSPQPALARPGCARPTCCPLPAARRRCRASRCSGRCRAGATRPSRARRRRRARRSPIMSRHLVVHGVLHLLGFDHEEIARGRAHGNAGAPYPRAAWASPIPIASGPAAMADAAEGGRPPAPTAKAPSQGFINWLRHLAARRNGEISLRQELEELIEEHERGGADRSARAPPPRQHPQAARTHRGRRDGAARRHRGARRSTRRFAEAARQMVEHGHSRMPVYRDTLDDVIGMVHFKDLLPYAVDGRAVPLGDLVRKVLFVAPSMPVLDLLLQMRLSRIAHGAGGRRVRRHRRARHHRGRDRGDRRRDRGRARRRRPAQADRARRRQRHRRCAHADRGARGARRRTAAPAGRGRGRHPGRTGVRAGGTRAGARRGRSSHPSGLEFEVLDADPRRVKRLRVRGLPPVERCHG